MAARSHSNARSRKEEKLFVASGIALMDHELTRSVPSEGARRKDQTV